MRIFVAFLPMSSERSPSPCPADDEHSLPKTVVDETGVVYLSRIPPQMTPLKLKQILSQFGEVGRCYLVPEPTRGPKPKSSGKISIKSRFIEGWVEFKFKKVAKQVAQQLNNTPIGTYQYSKWT